MRPCCINACNFSPHLIYYRSIMSATERRYGSPRRNRRNVSNLVANAARIGAVAVITTVGGLIAAKEAGVNIEDIPAGITQVIKAPFTLLPQEHDYQGSGKLFEQPIEPGIRKEFLTVGFGQVELPVRSEPGPDGHQIGFTLEGYKVEGVEVFGYQYLSNASVGSVVGPDGERYGEWFKADKVPLFRRTESGEYEPIGVATGAYMAENFLTTPPDEAQQ